MNIKEVTMLIVQDWINQGYKKFHSTFKEYADYGLQKLIKDEVGKKYFITVWVYENSYSRTYPGYVY